MVIDQMPAQQIVEANAGLKVLDEPLTEEEYAIAVAKDREDLKAVVDQVLSGMLADGNRRRSDCGAYGCVVRVIRMVNFAEGSVTSLCFIPAETKEAACGVILGSSSIPTSLRTAGTCCT